MADRAEYEAKLNEALKDRRQELSGRASPKLKEALRTLRSSFDTLHGVLVKRGVVREDPYRHEYRFAEITIPPAEQFIDSQRDEQMMIRLAQYSAALDYVANYVSVEVDQLDLKTIKQLAAFLRYIRWDQLSASAGNVTGRTLAEYIAKIRTDDGDVSIGILKDAGERLRKTTGEISELLKEFAEYAKQAYKYDLRVEVMDDLPLSAGEYENDPGAVRDKVRRRYAQLMPGTPFYPDMVDEVMREDFVDGGDQLRQRILSQLKPGKSEPATKAPAVNTNRTMLLDAFKALAMAGRQIEAAMSKLTENAALLDNKKLSFMERLRRLIDRLTNKQDTGREYRVEYVDITTSATKSETIRFDHLAEGAAKRARLLNAVLARAGTTYQKMARMEDAKLLQFLERSIREVQSLHRRMEALDTYFKAEVPREERQRLRGISVELSAIRNAIVAANRHRHEYAAKAEEEEQLRRLGVAPNP